MPKPHIVLRPKVVREKYIPIGHTEFEGLVHQGFLEVVPLTPLGRAKGITLASVIRYQETIMGLAPLPDDAPETAIEHGHSSELIKRFQPRNAPKDASEITSGMSQARGQRHD